MEAALKQGHADREWGESLPAGGSKGGDRMRGDGCGVEPAPAAGCPLDRRGPPAQGESPGAGGSEGVSTSTARFRFVPTTRVIFRKP